MASKRSLVSVDREHLISPAQKMKKQKMERPTFSDAEALVTFIIGTEPNTTRFIAHKEHICMRSPVLRRAFNSQFIEGQTQTYRLDDGTSPAVFRLFMQYVYSEKIETIERSHDKSIAVGDMHSGRDVGTRSHLELWVLADKFDMPCLQNLAFDTIRGFYAHRRCSLFRHLEYIYAKTAADSPLRRYAVRQAALMRPEVIPQYSSCLPYGLLLDLVIYQAGRTKASPIEHESFYVPVTTHAECEVGKHVAGQGVDM